MIDRADHWGPWHPAISHAERVARLRVLRAITHLYCGQMHPLVKALWLAESGEIAELEAALIELNRLSAKQLRHVIAWYSDHQNYRVDGKRQTELVGGG